MATKLVNIETIGSYFESLSDPRHTRNRKHLLVDIVVIAVCGILCGSDGPTAIHRWADNRRDWLETFLSLPNGIELNRFAVGKNELPLARRPPRPFPSDLVPSPLCPLL